MKLFSVPQIHQLHAHGVSANGADFLYARAHHLAFRSDEHQLILIRDGQRADYIASLLAGLHGDDAFSTARLTAVILKWCPLADAILAGHE